ncbi:MAG: carbohydrate-binding domain-containing protein, partial [Bacilli bacterium]|nr:carbohydrate-binding domain-containing protein [Bacilli bacterium]
TSADDGIRGKDSVYIKNGTFKIEAKGDGIKSTNDTDSEKGYVLIENGTFEINATLDGIQAETKLLIQNGTFDITTGGGSSITSTREDWGRWGTTSSNNDSAKGIKSGDNLVIENGVITIDSSDDAIHSNNYLGIKSGTYYISSGDDGMHADTELIIDNGEIGITKSYEGLEASKITINDGNISVVASDDGINVAGGNDSSSMGRPGANNFSSNANCILTINGGTIYVDASGDGLDSNGSIYMYGGTVTVDGSTNSGNGALDYDKECVIHGGILVAGGASGMSQGASSSSSIYNLLINFTSNYGDSDTITIIDSNNQEIVSYHSDKSYSSLVVASPKLKNGNTYTIKVNGSDYQTFTISSINTTIGSMQTMGGHGGDPGRNPGGNPGGNRGGGNRRPR